DVRGKAVTVEGRSADSEEKLLRVRHGGAGSLAGQRETRDLVRDADQPTEKRGPFDDRGIARRMRDCRHVLHETDEELRAPDRVELFVRDEVRLHVRESDLLASLRD